MCVNSCRVRYKLGERERERKIVVEKGKMEIERNKYREIVRENERERGKEIKRKSYKERKRMKR